jgi:hypothetical protein
VTLAVASALLSLSFVLDAGAAQKIPVLTRAKSGEFQPARGNGYLAWERNTSARPNWYNVYARRDGQRRFRVNAPGTQGAMGGIEGTSLVYQQFKGSRSNIKFYNLETRKRSSPRVYVNTRKWEYWPSISGDWILFGRRNASATKRKVILFNRATLAVRIIDETTNARSFISPGQVNGEFVVWHRCRPVPNCDVYRYNIRTRLTRRIPTGGSASQHGASVTSDGTVYMTRSGKKCGHKVRLMRFPVGGPATLLSRLSKGRNSFDSFALTDETGANHFYFEVSRCNAAARSDIYKIVD